MRVGSVHDTVKTMEKFIVNVPKELLFYAQDNNIDIAEVIKEFVFGEGEVLIVAEDLSFEIESTEILGEIDGNILKQIILKEK